MEHALALGTGFVAAWIAAASIVAVLVGRACAIRERQGH